MHIASVMTVITACFDLRKGATAAPETSSCMFVFTCLVEVVKMSIFESQEFRGLKLLVALARRELVQIVHRVCDKGRVRRWTSVVVGKCGRGRVWQRTCSSVDMCGG